MCFIAFQFHLKFGYPPSELVKCLVKKPSFYIPRLIDAFQFHLKFGYPPSELVKCLVKKPSFYIPRAFQFHLKYRLPTKRIGQVLGKETIVLHTPFIAFQFHLKFGYPPSELVKCLVKKPSFYIPRLLLFSSTWNSATHQANWSSAW